MNKNDFASVVPKIKVWETKLLNKSFYDKLLDSNSLEEAVGFLQETPYGAELNKDNFEKTLNDSYKNLCSELHKSMKDNKIVDLVRLKNDYHNAKTLIKSRVLNNKDFSYILSNNGNINIDSIKVTLKGDGYREIPELLSKAMFEALESFEQTKDSQIIDIVFDRYMFENIVDVSKDINNAFVAGYVQSLIDLTNIKTILRLKKINKDKNFLKKVLIDGGVLSLDFCEGLFNDSVDNLSNKIFFTNYANLINEGVNDYKETNSLSSLERKIDDYLMNYIKDAKYISIGVEPVFAYLYAVETEVKNLRLILAGKLNDVDSEIIRERLRESYV